MEKGHDRRWMGHCTGKKQALPTVQWMGHCEFESWDRCDDFFNNVTNQERRVEPMARSLQHSGTQPASHICIFAHILLDHPGFEMFFLPWIPSARANFLNIFLSIYSNVLFLILLDGSLGFLSWFQVFSWEHHPFHMSESRHSLSGHSSWSYPRFSFCLDGWLTWAFSFVIFPNGGSSIRGPHTVILAGRMTLT